MNVLDYLASEFSSFKEKPFNTVDSAILSQICMVHAEKVIPALPERKGLSSWGSRLRNIVDPATRPVHFIDLLRAEYYETMFTGLVPGLIKENLLAVAASPRFREMVVSDYVSLFDEKRNTQFAAMTFSYGREFSYIAFRGTDTSLAGWHENFDMAHEQAVPAQQQALAYLEAVAKRARGRLVVGGHSKGGNLALYAALHAKPAVKSKIDLVYSHDGPGFKADSVSRDLWDSLDGRIHRTVPQDSVVGLLMDNPAPLRVVESTAKGIDQHSVFTWEVGEGDFVYRDELSDSAKFTRDVLHEWLALFSDDEAEEVVDALFAAIAVSGAKDASDIFLAGPKMVPLIMAAAKNVDANSRAVLTSALGSLGEVAARHAFGGVTAAAQGAFEKLGAIAALRREE